MKNLVGYTFIRGVDGFGEDITPAYEEGVYLDYNKAYKHFKKLTKERLKANKQTGFGYWTSSNNYVELTNIDKICQYLLDCEDVPFGYYLMVEVEIIK